MIDGVSITDRVSEASDDITALAAGRSASEGLVLLPDVLSPIDGELIGGFRPPAQALRVSALKRGIPVELALPEGAKAGFYSEHTADWVLPLILGVPTAIVASLVATQLQRGLDAWRSRGTARVPTVRYREAITEGREDRTYVREIEGPADAVLEWLKEERGAVPEIEAGDDDEA
jgi:molybdopterin-biosynthesis enzyme MoeA-like protein